MKKNFFSRMSALVLVSAMIFSCSVPTDVAEVKSDAPSTRAAYTDNVPPSQNPPGGLLPSEVPMLVSIGFDDNAYSGLEGSAGTGGMSWANNFFKNKVNNGAGNPGTFDRTPVRATFYNSTIYVSTWSAESPTLVKKAWHDAYVDGHEIGNHTQAHGHGAAYSYDKWYSELNTAHDWLTKPYDATTLTHSPDATKGSGVAAADIVGFRTPYLEYNDNTFKAVKAMGYAYDCSVNEGFQADQDGTNNFWPYTLDNGSPGNKVSVSWGSAELIGSHPGLWEMPLYAVIVPPDELCAQYGVPSGLRAKLAGNVTWNWDTASAKITGLDYNMFWSFKMTKEEALASLKYTLDLRLQGNRAPFMFGAHSDYYSSKKVDSPGATYLDRQWTLEKFVEYAMSKPEVRIVPVKDVLSYMKNPVKLNAGPVEQFQITSTVSAGQGTITPAGTVTVDQYSNNTYTFAPAAGYKVGTVTVNGAAVTPVNNSYTISSIQANTTIDVTFVAAPVYTVTATAGANGTITPATASVTEGGDAVFTIAPAAGYLVDTVTVNGAAVAAPADNVLTVTNVTADTAVAVTFKAEPVVVEGLSATYTVDQDWGTGFGATVVVKNTGSSAVSSWTVTITYSGNQKVSGWNAQISQNGNVVTATNLSWNGNLAPGATVSFGFNGSYTGTNEMPVVTAK